MPYLLHDYGGCSIQLCLTCNVLRIFTKICFCVRWFLEISCTEISYCFKTLADSEYLNALHLFGLGNFSIQTSNLWGLWEVSNSCIPYFLMLLLVFQYLDALPFNGSGISSILSELRNVVLHNCITVAGGLGWSSVHACFICGLFLHTFNT